MAKAKKTGDPLENYNPEEWPKDEEARRRTWMDAMSTQFILQHRVSVLEQENKRLRGQNDYIQEDTQVKIKDKDQTIKRQLKDQNKNEDKIAVLEEQVEQLGETIEQREEEIAKIDQSLRDKFNEEKKMLERKIRDLEIKNNELIEYGEKQEQYNIEMAQLKNELTQEKKDKQLELGEMEREKIRATEKLRKEMLFKIKETKANLLALNDEQLQTTTRLTILQNHQLTTELEYQSKQTEQLLFRNNKMKQKIETLNRDIAIHREVEKELAKRSHFCQKVIKKLKIQVKDLEEGGGKRNDNAQFSQTVSAGFGHNRRASVGLPQQRQGASKSAFSVRDGYATQVDPSKQNNDELINFLEHKLDEIEKQLQKSQKEYEQLYGEYMQMQEKMGASREKYKKAALILTEFLDDLLSSQPNILDTDKDMHLNLDKIKKVPFDELQKDDKVALALVLLKQLQPYLSTNNLSTAPSKGQGQFHQRKISQDVIAQNREMATTVRSVQKNNFISSKADDILKDHGASGTAMEVDALNNILNNINVQQQPHKIGGKPQRLPPLQSRE